MSKPCCHKCNQDVSSIKGYLDRVNPKGEIPAIWECRPYCGFSPDPESDEGFNAIFAAIEGTQGA